MRPKEVVDGVNLYLSCYIPFNYHKHNSRNRLGPCDLKKTTSVRQWIRLSSILAITIEVDLMLKYPLLGNKKTTDFFSHHRVNI